MEGYHRGACFLHTIRKTNVLASADCEAFASMVCRFFLAWAGPSSWHVPGNTAFSRDLQLLACIINERIF